MKESKYKTIKSRSEAVFRDRGSRFIAIAEHVEQVEDVNQFLDELKKLHPTARHVCYAYRINPESEQWRANDDGEPSGSAGKPILNQLRSMMLFNTVVAVIRYFGGTLLGVPGLINAYKESTRMALQEAEIVEEEISRLIIIKIPHEQSGNLSNLLKRFHLKYRIKPDGALLQVEINVPLHELDKTVEILLEKGFKPAAES